MGLHHEVQTCVVAMCPPEPASELHAIVGQLGRLISVSAALDHPLERLLLRALVSGGGSCANEAMALWRHLSVASFSCRMVSRSASAMIASASLSKLGMPASGSHH